MESSEVKGEIPGLVNQTTKISAEVGERSEERSVLYEKGLQFKRNASYPHALQCFLGCLQNIKDDARFPELPQCLRNIAEIYSTLGEYEKAIEFVQAEKLFYETALIQAGRKESSDLEKQGKQTKLTDPTASSEEAQLANEYEKLAQMCLKEKKVQLALEYAGKATQLRKKIYGDSHPITTISLNQFTLIYAEMGKEQYTAAMKKFSKKGESEKPVTEEKSEKENSKKEEKLKKEEFSNKAANNCESINEEESSENIDNESETLSQNLMEEPKEKVFPGTIVFLYFFLTLMTSVVLTGIVCYVLDTDIHSLHSYVLQRLKFYYYYYFNSSVSGIRYM